MTEILTAILVVITGVYAWLTYRMAKSSEASVAAMREQAEAMARPYITVTPYIRPHTTIVCLRIANTGRSTAKNVLLSLARDYFEFKGEDEFYQKLGTKSAFNHAIDSIPPGTEFSFALVNGLKIPANPTAPGEFPVRFTVIASYEFFAQEVREEHHIDLGGFSGAELVRDPVVEELERIRKVLAGTGPTRPT
jgi:hypothetical protein